jgi:hypothetical protein
MTIFNPSWGGQRGLAPMAPFELPTSRDRPSSVYTYLGACLIPELLLLAPLLAFQMTGKGATGNAQLSWKSDVTAVTATSKHCCRTKSRAQTRKQTHTHVCHARWHSFGLNLPSTGVHPHTPSHKH